MTAAFWMLMSEACRRKRGVSDAMGSESESGTNERRPVVGDLVRARERRRSEGWKLEAETSWTHVDMDGSTDPRRHDALVHLHPREGASAKGEQQPMRGVSRAHREDHGCGRSSDDHLAEETAGDGRG